MITAIVISLLMQAEHKALLEAAEKKGVLVMVEVSRSRIQLPKDLSP